MIVGATPPVSNPEGSPYVMKIASLKAEWASVRQAAIAGNIANADTPDYKARDIEPFSVQRQETRLRLAATRPNHMQLSPLGLQANEVDEVSGWEVAHSANTVSIDEQLMKSGETERHHTMSLSVLRTFHRMILQSVAFR